MKNNALSKIFEDIAELCPDNVAIEDGKQSVTYQQLNQLSDHVANGLKAHGIMKGRVVGVYLDSSIPYIIAILGVMKADAIFMPVNTEFPAHRLSAVLNKTGPDAFITDVHRQTEFIDKLHQKNINCIADGLFVINEQMALMKKTNIPPNRSQSTYYVKPKVTRNKTNDSCYIITTSGSTGEPKAILGSTKGLDHFISWEKNEFGFNENTRCSQLSPVTFDVSLRDIFVPLTSGGTLCIPDKNTMRSPEKLARWMTESEITLTHIVPTLFRMLTREIANKKMDQMNLPALKHALIAGEMLFGNDVINWWDTVGDHVELVNIYGPSETTLAKLFYRVGNNGVKPKDVIPVGKPISDTEVKIFNDGALCSPGKRGEIYIKTPFMSNGYYNAPELDKRSFIVDPSSGEETSIIYKTGDIGYFMPDGNLILTGRIDGQIKLHGKRIETGEIEVVLMRHPDIQCAAISVISDASGNRRLAGYIVPEDKATIAVDSLRKFVKSQLPDHMIPNIFVTLESLPLTHNGKVDRKALPAPDLSRPEMEQNYEPPATPMEENLAEVWGELLSISAVGVHDNFFDLGGDSILCAQVAEMLNQKFHIQLDVVVLFQYPTIRLLADNLSKIKDNSYSINEVQNRGRRRQVLERRRIRPG